jgi:hypothetical protein
VPTSRAAAALENHMAVFQELLFVASTKVTEAAINLSEGLLVGTSVERQRRKSLFLIAVRADLDPGSTSRRNREQLDDLLAVYIPDEGDGPAQWLARWVKTEREMKLAGQQLSPEEFFKAADLTEEQRLQAVLFWRDRIAGEGGLRATTQPALGNSRDLSGNHGLGQRGGRFVVSGRVSRRGRPAAPERPRRAPGRR